MKDKKWIIGGIAFLVIVACVAGFLYTGKPTAKIVGPKSIPIKLSELEKKSLIKPLSSKLPREKTEAPIPEVHSYAKVRIGGKTYEPTVNDLGYFEQIPIGLKDKGEVRITYPEATPGDKIILQMVDGGLLDNKYGAKMVQLDEQKSASFQFNTTHLNGIYRIVVRKGADAKVLSFWAGEPQQFRQ